ncbi:DUF2007 domain-containing protein [Polaribacter sp. MED152]|uniref:putative signal transducing protein n=1 Tax=Polaribacter sp. MED152 TaxID=313598 RepID=UPI0000689B47|nr:DUF2007 domain-containing protein [Polaribacter sp. MED152]EAQ40681.1 hypothetical protein MED152_11624 [Polaribacter sp. MED152]
MEIEYIKVFTGSSILVNRLNSLLEEANIKTIIKDRVNSGNLAGFGALGNSIELYAANTDLDKANAVVENFKNEINS